MFERIFPWWLSVMFLSFIISVLIMALGHFLNRKLPTEVKKFHRKNFGYYALIPIVFGIIFSQPIISSFTNVEFLEKLNPENLTSFEKISDFEKDQTEQIEKLKSEVIELRNDLNNITEHYYFVILFSMVVSMSFISINISKLNEKILDEKRKENILNL